MGLGQDLVEGTDEVVDLLVTDDERGQAASSNATCTLRSGSLGCLQVSGHRVTGPNSISPSAPLGPVCQISCRISPRPVR
jgi:hypothetical protein